MPVIDPAALDRLRELDPEGDKGLVGAVLEAFLADAPGAREQLATESAVAPGERARAAHALRSAAENVGARELARLCTELESRARAGEVALDSALDALCAELESVCAALEEHVALEVRA